MTALPSGTLILFGVLVLGWLAFDLFVLGRKSHIMSVREATIVSAGLIALALLFGGYIAYTSGPAKSLEYYAGYLIELSLSVDNLFVFLLIFRYFAVPGEAQPKVLKWGVFDAIILRAIMIGLGTLVLQRFDWVIYLLGGVLVITAWRMFRSSEIQVEPDKNPLVKLARRFLPISDSYDGTRFFTKIGGRRFGTPLILVIMVVEWTDIMFAVDSIPAIFAVTKDPFIIYSSNIFAILGLRALFFVLAHAMERFAYLKPAVTIILGFVGLKMITSAWIHIPITLSLLVIVGTLATAILLSVAKERRKALG
jgi:tellurite resistance protein TerC